MIKLYTMNVTDIVLREVYGKMSEKRLEKLMRQKTEQAKKQSAGAELLLNEAAKDFFPDIQIPVIWDTDYFKKPYLPMYPNFRFNISHSGDYAVCAVSDVPVGVDIQLMRSINPNIAKKYFTENELGYMHAACNAEEAFYEIWVRKESLVKAVGKGLKIPLSSFCVLEDTTEYNGEKYTFTPYEFKDKSYKLCICQKG